ncbi:hypothetical protein BKA69DRAFT_1026902 [Paraphysoderma sedebokerense]|nr:hypothetical protein BKA69DRAFT_1026902 [Paraphysoderma sedebokerense]
MEVDDDNGVDEENAPSAEKWRNRAKQRVLLISSRGINHQHRHLFNDLNALLPHSKKDAKIDSKNNLQILNELCELSNCNNCIFFEVRRKQDLYMWMSKAPNGPSIKFHVLNIHTMDELKLTGNALKGSRPLLSFDKNFDSEPHLMLMKEVLKHLFNTPRGHRKSKPFIDHIISFTVADNKIWFRNYQVSPSPGATPSKATNQPITLTEIGPRFVLTPIKVFDGSFGGRTMWSNDDYVTPTKIRLMEKQAKSVKYKERMKQQVETKVKKKENALEEDPIDSVFKA